LTREKVEEVIAIIRPAMQADGGDLVLHDVDVDTGRVSVELVGACGECPMSEMDLKLGVERVLIDRVEGVTEVVAVGQTQMPSAGTAVDL
jgi:Fe-S cluster biogenesis protein NfuA